MIPVEIYLGYKKEVLECYWITFMLLEHTNVSYYKIFVIYKLMFYTYVIILNITTYGWLRRKQYQDKQGF